VERVRGMIGVDMLGLPSTQETWQVNRGVHQKIWGRWQ
jgi:hypothetical protein